MKETSWLLWREGLLQVADGLIAGSPWLGHQRKWSVSAFCSHVFQSISEIGFGN